MWLEANVNLLLICELTVLFSVTGLRVCCVELVSPSLQAFLAGDGGETCLCKTHQKNYKISGIAGGSLGRVVPVTESTETS